MGGKKEGGEENLRRNNLCMSYSNDFVIGGSNTMVNVKFDEMGEEEALMVVRNVKQSSPSNCFAPTSQIINSYDTCRTIGQE